MTDQTGPPGPDGEMGIGANVTANIRSAFGPVPGADGEKTAPAVHKSGVPAVLEGIGNALEAAFGGVAVYTDGAGNQETAPCFAVTVRNPSRSPEPGLRYRARNPFDIRYFPAVKGSVAELLDVGERLWDVLEQVLAEGNPLRGSAMSYELVDGTLRFSVNYDFTGRKAAPADPEMEDVFVNTHIGKGE